jgi:hypothetical protein
VVACALVVALVAGVRGIWSPCGLSMLSAINPVSEAGRGHRYGITCAWFVLGSLLGGLTLGAGAAVVSLPAGLLDGTTLAAVGAAVALVTLGSDLKVGGWSLPHHPRQVDETWFGAYRRWAYAAGFGAQIGVGFATYVMTAATYLLVVLAALTGSPGWALVAGGAFGLVRGFAVLLSATAQTPHELRVLHRRLAVLDPWSLRAAMLVQAGAAVVLALISFGTIGGVLVSAACLVVAGAQRIEGTASRTATRLRS